MPVVTLQISVISIAVAQRSTRDNLTFTTLWIKEQYPPSKLITYRQHSRELLRLLQCPILSC
jgi:hypothetical protein